MRIGIDLGGTKIEGVVLGHQGEVIIRRRRATPAESYADTLQAVVDLVAELESALGGRASVGVATPGALSPHSGRIKNANSTQFLGERLDVDLGEALDRQVRLANDANCFALSESVDGAARGGARGVRRHSRHRRGRRHRRRGPGAPRAPGHRRRVGTQSVALAPGQ